MKLIRASRNQFVFQLVVGERHVLLELLKRYPCIPSAHHRLSRSAKLPEPEANQRLLDEALAEQRAENKQKVLAFLAEPQRFAPKDDGYHLKLSPAEVEWLLEVLNDIRVGSWILLGSPEEEVEELDDTTAPHAWAMDMAGYFESWLIEAVQGGRDA